MAKKEYLSRITPKGTINWAFFVKPRDGFEGGEPKYGVDMVYDLGNKEVKDFFNMVEQWCKDNASNKKARPWTIDTEANTLTLKARSKSKPVICDGQKNELNCLVGNGSIGRIQVSFGVYMKGVCAYLNAAQVINLVKYEGGSTRGIDAFDVVEGSQDSSGSTPEDNDLPF